MSSAAPNTIDRRMAWPMFTVGTLFLISLAGTLQYSGGEQRWEAGFRFCAWALLALYPCFVLETLVHGFRRSPKWRRHLLYCFVPPLRIACRDTTTGETVWLPWMGWKTCNEKLQDQVESHFSIPMIFVALLILPLLAIKQF